MNKFRLGILGSTRGTNLIPIIKAINEKILAAEIVLVISNKEQALILEKAKDNSLPYQFLSPVNLSREAYDQKLSALFKEYDVNLILLIGYMRILSSGFVKDWKGKILNVHPSLLPEFAGGMDNDIHTQVLASGRNETGCTIHYVTEEVDAGPIVLQKRCPVLPDDTAETLKQRVQKIEGEAWIETLMGLVEY